MAKKYEYGEDRGALTRAQLRRADRLTQMEVMKHWFLQHFTDPIDTCPFESAEGGYQFIWGGPYEPFEELSSEFSDIVPDESIDELASELSEQASEWSGVPDRGDEDTYPSLIAAVKDNFDPVSTLRLWMDNIRELLKQKVQPHLREQYDHLLYVSAITALETFLSDCFTNQVVRDPKLLRTFVETNPDFMQVKLPLSEIYSRMEAIEPTVRAYLAKMLWHNLAKVKPMYKSTLNCEFPKRISEIAAAIETRHHIVHRGAKMKDGKIVQVSANEVRKLAKRIESLTSHIDKQIPSKRPF